MSSYIKFIVKKIREDLDKKTTSRQHVENDFLMLKIILSILSDIKF